MNMKRRVYASVAVFLIVLVLETVINGVLLDDLYNQTASAWRTQAEIESKMWLFWIGYAILAPVFVTIYLKGREPGKPGWAQGLRFGAYIGVLLAVPTNLTLYAVLPIPFVLAAYWTVAGLTEMIVSGLAVGLICRE